MSSHVYAFTFYQLARRLVWLVLPLVSVGGLLHLGAALGLLPKPRPMPDIDHTVLTHQAEAAITKRGADVVLLGDSSCLMDVSGRALEQHLGPEHRVLNLSCLSYVDLGTSGNLLARYAANNPGLPRTVVVLLHPEMLRGVEPVPEFADRIDACLRGADFCGATTLFERASCWLGLETFRGRVFDRIVPAPIHGAFGYYYGFTSDLDRYMTQDRGSLIDPNQFSPGPGQGSAEYRLARRLEVPSRELRAALPRHSQVLAGVTPVPASFALAGYPARHRAILAEWGGWMRADRLLTNLPPTLPDSLFASVTHLNQRGQQQFTALLARALSP